MTLIQIKQNQISLNNLFQQRLDELEKIILEIVGTYPEDIPKIKEDKSDGLIQEIESAQKSLERKIDKLNTLKQRLHNSTFKPTDRIEQ